MKNKMIDVHNMLVLQMERLDQLTDKDGGSLSNEEIEREFKRAKALNDTAAQITALNQLTIDAQKLLPPDERNIPTLIGG
jgi:hypothetical protein